MMSFVCLSVYLSVTLCIVAKWYIVQQKWIGTDSRNTLNSPCSNLYPITSNSHLLRHRQWCHLANRLKPYCKQQNRLNFHVWNSHRQHAARLFQTPPYSRLFLNNSWATYLHSSCIYCDVCVFVGMRHPVTNTVSRTIRVLTMLLTITAKSSKWWVTVWIALGVDESL